MRTIWVLLVALWLGACATVPGPRSFTLSAADIERSIRTELGSMMEVFEGLDLPRPQVSLMPASDRLMLEWNARLPDGPGGAPLGVAVQISGAPVLNAARNGVDLKEVRIEDVRFAGLPRFLGLARIGDRKGMTLPDLPLMTLPPDRLRISDVAYAVTGIDVTYEGLRVDIAPK